MKLEEAASILGVPPSADLSVLRQAYRKLAIAFHPDKFTDSASREKFQMISLAYTKLISSKRQEEDEYDSDEENDYTEEDVHEMRAFMRMFMDLVGIFSDDQGSSSQDVHSSSGVPFGMANVGSLPAEVADEWSTEDEDEDEDEEDSDEDADENIFEPMAKSYYHMNLKEAAGDEQREAEEEAKRKLKNAKKKTDKRRKQKEKKQKETAERELEEEKLRAREEVARQQQEEQARHRKDELRRAQEEEAIRRMKMFDDSASGNADELRSIIDKNIMKCTERFSDNGKSGASLVHYAVFPPAQYTSDPKSLSATREGRLEVITYLLQLKSPTIDLSILDEAGCNVLHLASKSGDVAFADTILTVRSESHEKRNQLDLNARCLNFGYTALHYAADGGHFAIFAKLIDSGVLLNVHANYVGRVINSTDGTEPKGPTPLDLANSKLSRKGLSDSKKEEYRSIIEKLSTALAKIESARLAKEKEKAAKEAKLKAEKEAQLLKEQEEQELLDRKQRQLKEKQEKIARMRHSAEPAAPVVQDSSVSTAAGDNPPASSKKKKEKKKKTVEKAPAESGARANPPAAQGIYSDYVGHDPVPALQPEEMNSRAELLNHLLAMGFPEDQCHAAISACGLNADLAISWIVDRPAPRAASKSSPTKLTPAPTAAENTARNEAELREKALKEKERMRRINREWNAKVPQVRAEEERKKAQQEQEARLEAERMKMAQMLAPHLTFPAEMYPQTLGQVYGSNVMYAPGMPPQYNVAPAYTYGSNAPPYHMQQQSQQQFMGPTEILQPAGAMSYNGNGSSNSVPYSGGSGISPDAGGMPYPSQSRMQSWPAAVSTTGATGGNSGSPSFPPGLPLAPAVNLANMAAIPGKQTGSGFAGSSSGSSKYTSQGNVPQLTPGNAGFSGRSRGPSSPPRANTAGGLYGTRYGSPEQPRSVSRGPSPPKDPDYSDGALELSVRAREFVPRFGARDSSPSMDALVPSAASLGNSSESILGGMGMWNGAGKGSAGDLIGDSDDIVPPPLIFPSDSLGDLNGRNGSLGFGSWGLSDSMDLQIPLEGGSLRLGSSLASGMSSRFVGNDDDGDLDMDAAMLSSGIIGDLDDSDLLGGSSRVPRHASSFLSSFASMQSSELRSSRFHSSMFNDDETGGAFDSNGRDR